MNGKKDKTIYTAKHLSVIAVTVALLIGGQFVLSFAAGIEIVTPILCVFCIVFGVKDGVVAAVAFSLLRCLIFGFYPTVIVLYCIYFPLFALVTALYGKLLNKVFNDENGYTKGLKTLSFILLIVICVVLTACFTMIDNVITPLMLGFGEASAKAYFYSSLPTLALHCSNASITVSFLFFPLYNAVNYLKNKLNV